MTLRSSLASVAITLFAVSLIVSVSVPTSIRGAPNVYNKNLATEEFFWGRVLDGVRLTMTPDGLESKGAWNLDSNHQESGILVAPAVIWTAGKMGGLPIAPDLRETQIQLRIKFEPGSDFPVGSRMFFWFQSTLPTEAEWSGDPTRTVNYAWHEDLLASARADRKMVLTLTYRLDDWTCLGRNRRDIRRDNKEGFIGSASKYTCALNSEEFISAISKVDLDMGVIILLPHVDASGRPTDWGTSNGYPGQKFPKMAGAKLVLKEFKIVK